MRIIKYSVLAAVLLLTTGIALIFLTPSFIVQPLANYYLAASGFTVGEITGLAIGSGRSTVTRLQLHDDSTLIAIDNARLSYTLAEIFSGKFQALEVAQLQLDFMSTPSPEPAITQAATQSNDVAVAPGERIRAALETLEDLPLSDLRIDDMRIHSANTRLNLVVQMHTAPVHIVVTATSPDFSNLELKINADADTSNSDNQINAAVTVSQRAIEAAQLDLVITTDTNVLDLQAQAEIDVAAFLSIAQTANLIPGLSSGTETLQLNASLRVDELATSPILSALNIRLDAPDHGLNLDWPAAQSLATAQLSLPVQLSAITPANGPELALQVSPVTLQASYLAPEFELQNSATMSAIELRCAWPANCSASGTLSSQIAHVAVAGFEGNNLTLDTSLIATMGDNGFTLSTPAITLASTGEPLLHVDSATTAQLQATIAAADLNCSFTAVCQGSGELNLLGESLAAADFSVGNFSVGGAFQIAFADAETRLSAAALTVSLGAANINDTDISGAAVVSLDAQLGSQTTASAHIATDHLAIQRPNLSLRNPAFSGNINYANTVIDSTMGFSVANQIKSQLTANYNTSGQTGSLHWQLPTYYFSKITPLSALVNQSLVAADIVSGSVAGDAALNISVDESGSWQLNGPLTLSFDALSGFVEDTLFVGFSSELNAGISGSGEIASSDILSGAIATLDPGIALSNIHWNYSFDSADQLATLRNLTLDTLGGKISIADFDYKIPDPQTVLTVVLTNLDLQSLVDLAQYPQLTVEGLISGYIPVAITGDKITIEDGLVGALQPGGTIRYVAANSAGSGNASIDLMNRALANYHYQIMNTHVHYNDAGDLRLQVQLQGNNPDLYNGQVVNLNVNIEDNIPSLLRSLQASRTITDALEKRLQPKSPANPQSGNAPQ